MRICLITLDFPPFRSSGHAVYSEGVARGLAGRGHDVTVIAAARDDRQRVENTPAWPGIQVHRVPVGRFDWIGLGWQAGAYLRKYGRQFDVVHFLDLHFAFAYSGRFVASTFQSFRQRLTSDHGLPYHTTWLNLAFRLVYYSAARYLMEIPSLRRASCLVMPSRATQCEFTDNYGADTRKACLVYPGIELGHFARPCDRDAARKELGLPLTLPILLYVGFSTPRKGLEYLAMALSEMQSEAHLVMVGKWERFYREQFEALLGPARLRTHVTGYVPDAQLPLFFAAADVFVLPTLLEGFGLPLVEAMAAGIPVVTTSAGSAAEVVGDAGLAVPAGNSRQLAEALDRIITDSVFGQDLGRRGIERSKQFTLERAAEELEDVYTRSLCRQSSGERP